MCVCCHYQLSEREREREFGYIRVSTEIKNKGSVDFIRTGQKKRGFRIHHKGCVLRQRIESVYIRTLH